LGNFTQKGDNRVKKQIQGKKIRPKNKILKNVLPGAQAPCKSGSAKARPCGLGKILTPDPMLNMPKYREKGRLVALP
jgi:hypothetical protein